MSCGIISIAKIIKHGITMMKYRSHFHTYIMLHIIMKNFTVVGEKYLLCIE